MEPYLYDTDLLSQAKEVLRFLERANAEERLDDIAVMTHTVTVRYNLFLQIQSENHNEVLVPPFDVEAVWWSHMLQSVRSIWVTF